MKLNLHILFDELKNFSCKLQADDDLELRLSGLRFLPEVRHSCAEEYLYLVTADELSTCINCRQDLNFLCIGEVDSKYFQQQGWQALIIAERVNKFELFDRVQGLFEEYSKWDNDLAGACLHKLPLQALLDITARPLRNPFALFDLSFTYIASAGPPLPEEIRGTIWEAVLGKGYSPVEAMTHAAREEMFEHLECIRLPYITHPTRVYIDKNYLIAPVFRGGQLFGFTGASDICAHFSLGQVSLTKHLCSYLDIYFSNTSEFSELGEENLFYVDRILQGFSIPPNVVSFNLAKRGWKLQSNFRLFFFTSDSANLKEA